MCGTGAWVGGKMYKDLKIIQRKLLKCTIVICSYLLGMESENWGIYTLSYNLHYLNFFLNCMHYFWDDDEDDSERR